MTKSQLDAEWHVSIEQALDMEARGAGPLHADQRFPPRLRSLRRQEEPEFKGD